MVLQNPLLGGLPREQRVPGDDWCPPLPVPLGWLSAGWGAGAAPSYGQSFRNCTFIFPASKPESARGGLMTHGTPEIIFMGIDP